MKSVILFLIINNHIFLLSIDMYDSPTQIYYRPAGNDNYELLVVQSVLTDILVLPISF